MPPLCYQRLDLKPWLSRNCQGLNTYIFWEKPSPLTNQDTCTLFDHTEAGLGSTHLHRQGIQNIDIHWGSRAGGAATCSVLALFPMRLLMTRNKCRLAACLCTESLWRESFISTIATLFCKFSFAESRCSFPEKRELYLVTSQLILVPSASLILQHSALSLIQTFTTLIASLNFCCPTSYWIPRSSQFCNMEITLSVKRELDSILSRSIVSKETDVGYKYSVKNLHSTPVAVLKRRRFSSQTSFCQFQIPFLNTFCCLFLLKNKWLYAVTRKPWEVRGLPFHAACMVWAGRLFPKENRRRARSLSLLSGACA